MPTIIDALVVSLGLDAKDFKKGTDDTNKALEDTQRRASQSAVAVTQSQNKAQAALRTTGGHADAAANSLVSGANRSGSAFRSLDVQASTTARSVAHAGKTMLEPFAQLAFGIGTAAIGIEAIQKAISGSLGMAPADAALGRAAAQYGIPLKEFSAWGNAVGSFGGDATAAQGTLASLAQQQAQARLTGQISPAMQMLYSFGINPQEDPVQIMKDLAASPRFRGLSPASQTTIAQGMLGFDPGSTQLIERGPAALAAALASGGQNGMTQQQYNAEQGIVDASNKLWQSFRTLGRDIDVEVAPGLVKFLTAIQGIISWIDSMLGINTAPNNNIGTGPTPDQVISNPIKVSGAPSSKTQKDVFEQGMKSLTAAGLTPAQAAGVMSNAYYESSYNTSPSVNPANPHYGLFQWSASRRAQILSNFGIDVATAGAADQYSAFTQEMQRFYPAVWAKLKGEKGGLAGWNSAADVAVGYEKFDDAQHKNMRERAVREATGQLLSVEWAEHNAMNRVGQWFKGRVGAAVQHTNNITVNAPSGDAHHIAKTIVSKLAQHQGSVAQAGGGLS